MSKKPGPSEPLQAHVDWYVDHGWEVTSQTDDLARLEKTPGTLMRVFHILDLDPRDHTKFCILYLDDGLVRTDIGSTGIDSG